MDWLLRLFFKFRHGSSFFRSPIKLVYLTLFVIELQFRLSLDDGVWLNLINCKA